MLRSMINSVVVSLSCVLVVAPMGCAPTGPATKAALSPEQAQQRQADFIRGETKKLAKAKAEFESTKSRIQQRDQIERAIASKLGEAAKRDVFPIDQIGRAHV